MMNNTQVIPLKLIQEVYQQVMEKRKQKVLLQPVQQTQETQKNRPKVRFSHD